MKKLQNKSTNKNKKEIVPLKQKYYKINADFNYLKQFGYKITKQIGRGGYGVVYKAEDIIRDPNTICAIKINFNTVSRQLIYSQMAYLQLVKNHSNLPKMLNVFTHNEITHIVIEYFKYKPFISFFHTFSLQDIKHYLIQLLIGLHQLKQLGIYHRDIKPGNFLYNPQIKKGIIIDFGLAQLDPNHIQKITKKMSQMREENDPHLKIEEQIMNLYKRLAECSKTIGRNKIGTQTYMPIESMLHHKNQSYSSDIWPVGVILLQFIARKYNIFNNVRMVNKPLGVRHQYIINYLIELYTFYGDRLYEICRKLNYQLMVPSNIEKLYFSDIADIQGYNAQVDDLLNRLLDLDADTRISVQDAINHSFFDSVRQEHLQSSKYSIQQINDIQFL